MAPGSETVNRVPTINSWIDEEGIAPSPMKKQKLDDEENEGSNSSDIDSSDEKMPDPKPEPELGSEPPEWDVDSYDGREYISDPDYREFFKKEDDYQLFRLHRIQVLASKGFLEDPFNRVYTMGDNQESFASIISTILSLCIERFNKEKGKIVEFVNVERVNLRTGRRFQFYITFMAKEGPDGPPVEYQAKGMIHAAKDNQVYPILCRPSPISTLGII